ncbi:MAG: hypothetical protein K6F99_00125 [Lachnospiraceae bacterium]|nr:hypothetical protein [Lachnospiraceae bacterium]
MDDHFDPNEKLYRAIYPPEVAEMFWRKDGTVSSAAFADPKGLSVDRGDHRSDETVVSIMRERFTGRIISLYVKNCVNVGASVKYLPSAHNTYHSEIHGSDTVVLLSKQQRVALSRKAVILAESH